MFEQGQTVRASRLYGGGLYTVVRSDGDKVVLHEDGAPADFRLIGPASEFHEATGADFAEAEALGKAYRLTRGRMDGKELDEAFGDLTVSMANALSAARALRDRSRSVAEAGWRDDDKAYLSEAFDTLEMEMSNVTSYFAQAGDRAAATFRQEA